MIYDLWIINHHDWFNDLKSLKSNQPNFDLLFRFIIQLSSDLAEHCNLRHTNTRWLGQLYEPATLSGVVGGSGVVKMLLVVVRTVVVDTLLTEAGCLWPDDGRLLWLFLEHFLEVKAQREQSQGRSTYLLDGFRLEARTGVALSLASRAVLADSISGYCLPVQRPRKSSLSTDQNMTPPNPFSRTYWAYVWRLMDTVSHRLNQFVGSRPLTFLAAISSSSKPTHSPSL